VANIYDISGKLYLLKLSKANRKEFLLIESGIRIHTTDFTRNKKDTPSGFTMKVLFYYSQLRRHLRTRRLEKIEQVGMDRVINLTFGHGDNQFHILVELYAQGNVVLTDNDFTVLHLLRSHKFETDAKIAVKEKYPFTHAANLTIDSIVSDPAEIAKVIQDAKRVEEPVPEEEKKEGKNKKGKPHKAQKKKNENCSLKAIMLKLVPYISFPYAEHSLRLHGANPNDEADETMHVDLLQKAAQSCKEMVHQIDKCDEGVVKGFVIYTEDPNYKEVEEEKEERQMTANEGEEDRQLNIKKDEQELRFKGKLLKEFLPAVMLEQYKDQKYIEYESFD